MRLVERRRKRDMRGLVGDFTFGRPFYQCGACGGGVALDDARLGIDTVSYTPALSHVAAASSFRASGAEHIRGLGCGVCRSGHYRVVESLGVVVESEIQAEMAAFQKDIAVATPSGDTLLIDMDGVRPMAAVLRTLSAEADRLHMSAPGPSANAECRS